MSSGWDAETYARQFRFVPEYGRALIAILAPQKGESILDLGCGTGALTAELAESGAKVLGVDGDANMINVARQTYPALSFRQMNAEHLDVSENYDAVFSNAALHWMKIDRVFPEIARILRPGGRVAAEMGGIGNIAAIETAIDRTLDAMGLPAAGRPKPWAFPTPAEAAQKLEAAGMEVHYMNLYDSPSVLSEEAGGLIGWVRMFGRAILERLPEPRRQDFLQAVETAAKERLFYDGQWHADYRRFHFKAVKR